MAIIGQIPSPALIGIGPPEGRIEAPTGATWVDQAVTVGASRWVKTTATGATGWRVTDGDTGWRNISDLLEPGVTGNVFITRVGATVHLMINNVATTTTAHTNLIALPAGYRPIAISGANWRNGVVVTDNGDTTRTTSYFNGYMRILNMPAGKNFGGYLSMVAEPGWPAVRPGTPS